MKKTRFENSKKFKILEMLKIGKKPSFIAKELNVPVQYVYSVSWQSKGDKKTKTVTADNKGSLNVVKKRGRPTKQEKEDEEIRKFISDNIQLMEDNRYLLSENDNLRHQIVGYQAVISYLENQVGLRNSQ